MKATQFFKSLSWLLVLNLLIKPAWIFAIDRQVQNRVGPEVYGSYFALFNFTYVLLFIADAGLSNMLQQRFAAGESLNVRQLLTLKAALLFLYALACCGLATLWGVSQWRTLGLLIATQSLTSLYVFLRSLLTANQLFKTDAFFSVLDKSLLLLFCIGPVYGFFFRISIPTFLQLQVLSLSIAVVSVGIVLLRKKVFTPGEKHSLRSIALLTAPFVFIILLMSAHNRLDAFLLERLHPQGALQAGIYAMAYRLLDAANMVGYLTASFLVPFLSRNQNDRVVFQKVLLLSRHGLLLLSVVAVAFVVMFAPWLLRLLYHTTSAYHVTVLRLCLAALPAYFLIHLYGSALSATAQFSLFIRILFAAVLVNVLLNLLLAPSFGAAGCCTAALVSQYGCGLALWLTASKKLSLSLEKKSALRYLAVAFFSSTLFYSVQRLTASVWIILISIALIGFVLLLTQRNRLKKIFIPD